MIAQPRHQGEVVGEPPQQRHRRVGVQIDEAGNQRVLFQAQVLARIEALRGRSRRQHRDDTPFGDRNAVIGQHGPRGLDRDHPARADKEVDRLHVLEKAPRCSDFVIPAKAGIQWL